MTTHHITRATADIAVESLAAAFVDDPLMSWVFASDPASRLEHVTGWMRSEVTAAIGYGHAYADVDGHGAALWSPPDKNFYDNDTLTTEMFELVGAAEPDRSDMVAEGLMAIGEHFPQTAIFYLAVVGVAPAGRGAGVGGRLVSRVLDTCDSEGIDAYLESSNSRNVSLYERLGFEVTAELQMPENGPIIRPMYRRPR
jgi:ribosomal protein S18 acetylase RimI-like enzyme